MIKKQLIIRDGYHFNSLYWRKYRLSLPALDNDLMEITIAMVLSDASLVRTSKEAQIKIEQGYKQKEYVYHLFSLFQKYCFTLEPKTYFKNEKLKSYWFKTLSHPSFTSEKKIFYEKGKKIQNNIILSHINELGLSYWVMSDGSLQSDKKSMILHTQSFSLVENKILSKELNIKFGLHSKVIPHKKKYWVIFIPSVDGKTLLSLIKPHIIPYFNYKLPVIS